MDFTAWFQIVLVCILGAISPGPSLFIVVQNTATGGRFQGMMTSVGHGIGVGTYATAAIFGLVFIIDNHPEVYIFANWVGAIFLIFLGIKLWITSFLPARAKNKSSEVRSKNGFVAGLAIAFFNPKIAVFFMAVFSQFVTAEATWVEKITMILTVGFIDMGWYAAVAAFMSGDWIISQINRHSRLFDRAMGLVILFIAVGLIVDTY